MEAMLNPGVGDQHRVLANAAGYDERKLKSFWIVEHSIHRPNIPSTSILRLGIHLHRRSMLFRQILLP